MKNPGPLVTFLLLLAGSTGPLSAQAASGDDQTLDRILSSGAITWDQAAWLVGRADETLSEGAVPSPVPGKDGPLTLADFSQFLVQGFRIPGGIFYNLVPSARYAYRELVFRNLIPGGRAPDSLVSGQEALVYLQNVQAWKEAHP